MAMQICLTVEDNGTFTVSQGAPQEMQEGSQGASGQSFPTIGEALAAIKQMAQPEGDQSQPDTQEADAMMGGFRGMGKQGM